MPEALSRGQQGLRAVQFRSVGNVSYPIFETAPGALFQNQIISVQSALPPTKQSEDSMAEPTREEFDAKLAVVEARSETRFMELSGKIDRVVDAVGILNSTVEKELGRVRDDNKFTRLTIIVAVVGSVIAGLAALWVTQSNMLASFSAGLALHETKAESMAVPPARPSNQK